MKKLVALLILATAVVGAHAQSKKGYGYDVPTYRYDVPSYGYGYGSNPSSHYVAPTVRRDGSYVGGHYQSNPNDTKLDNWSTKGNYNPYTGKPGTKDPYKF